ncbi:hypothetical protein [Reichenbachiella versicolor]|uniref:hypothetical protein n=1 Tax=Reichenbachiella versicolor TaxID=1821036 RepID=UPI000D6E2622|nr:hypothetical protein [Reichenbachiella versicolor]
MEIREVTTEADRVAFIQFPVELYKNEPNWIRPLDKDIESVFDENINPTFKFGKCTRFLLRKEGKVIGKIAVFVNERTSSMNDQPTGGVGFFDCIDDQDAANMLFDQAKDWLVAEGMEAMDGPINFGERDKWWGCLVDGYDIEPNYQCNYNFPYYESLFEAYGFRIYFKQFTFIRNTFDAFHPRILHKSRMLNEDPNYHFEHMRLKNMSKYAEDFRVVYNKAWTSHEGVAEMSKEQAKGIMKQMKPILDEKIVWFAYYKGEPVAFYVNLPEVNQLFKYVNGKLDWKGKLKFVWHKWRKTNKKMLGLVFGVVPEHQGKGLDGALVMATAQMVQKDYKRYPKLEMNWIGDFNRRMILVVKQVGGEIGKTHHTYRYLFDRDKPFLRMPIK